MNESWQYTRQGLPSDTLEKVTSEIPTPSSGEIIVQVKALSVNPIDYKL
jgi:NADPH:quinone reductase-like Zn-dependent oxidoreductase